MGVNRTKFSDFKKMSWLRNSSMQVVIGEIKPNINQTKYLNKKICNM